VDPVPVRFSLPVEGAPGRCWGPVTKDSDLPLDQIPNEKSPRLCLSATAGLWGYGNSPLRSGSFTRRQMVVDERAGDLARIEDTYGDTDSQVIYLG
jgi:hypothetical protein